MSVFDRFQESPFGPLAEHMIKVIRGQEELCVKRQEVLNVIRALDGLYRSAQEGREVRFD